jgi:hypothetical protein
MPKLIPILIGYSLLVLFMLWTAQASAGLRLTWDYPAAPTDLAGFKVFVNDIMIHDVQNPDARSADIEPELQDADNIITMTAYDLAGGESAKSEPCVFNPAPDAPVNVTVHADTVTINIK